MQQEKVFIGEGKEKIFPNRGSIVACSINLDMIFKDYIKVGKDGVTQFVDLTALKKDVLERKTVGFFVSKNNDISVKFNVATRQSVSQYGQTHSVTLDTFVNTEKPATPPTPPVAQQQSTPPPQYTQQQVQQKQQQQEVLPKLEDDDLPF